MAIRSSELRKLTGRNRERALKRLAKGTQKAPNGELDNANEVIALFEERHGMSSDAMRSKLEAGELEETWEVCQWLLQLRRRDELVRLGEARG